MMDDAPRVFEYRTRTCFGRIIFPLVILIITTIIFASTVVGAVFSGAITENPVLVLVVVGFIFVFVAFTASLYVVGFPHIVVDDEKFRIQKPFFKSQWFKWESIHHIENARNTFAIGVDHHVKLICVSGIVLRKVDRCLFGQGCHRSIGVLNAHSERSMIRLTEQ